SRTAKTRCGRASSSTSGSRSTTRRTPSSCHPNRCRSEERRVGKECRTRREPEQSKKKGQNKKTWNAQQKSPDLDCRESGVTASGLDALITNASFPMGVEWYI